MLLRCPPECADLATEIDYDSTLVAGTRALVEELMKTSDIEALPVPTDADLSWQG
ncbi:hypothetical protein [Georgenia wutianyii]|uniref:hypothetical protein n=1 Tax=Georgenia wutianyii TaxID=2585135 RepID=UPI00143D3B6C|nr:hypothetical protein [Georgenia wutianyii]